jgi:predicted nuclease of predicted toxin-antitoxin system
MGPEVARLLRSWNEDVVSVHEVGTTGLLDPEQLAFAAAAGRAIVTCNFGDFHRLGTLWSETGRPHAGIILSYRQYSRNQVAVVARALLRLLDTIDAETLANTVQVLDLFRTDR